MERHLVMIMILAVMVAMEVEADGSCESNCVIHCSGISWYSRKICQNRCLVEQCNNPPETPKPTFLDYVYAHILVIVAMCYFKFLSLYVANWTRFIISKYKLFGDIDYIKRD
ncbi:unnamed protein product [Arabidopsis halleri]